MSKPTHQELLIELIKFKYPKMYKECFIISKNIHHAYNRTSLNNTTLLSRNSENNAIPPQLPAQSSVQSIKRSTIINFDLNKIEKSLQQKLKSVNFTIPPWEHKRDVVKSFPSYILQCKTILNFPENLMKYLEIGQANNYNLWKLEKNNNLNTTQIIKSKKKYIKKHQEWWEENKYKLFQI